MLIGLERQSGRILRGALDEAALYRDRRLRASRAAGRLPPGGLCCPICGTTARRFLSFGLAGRRNARCPRCGSLERHRLLWLYLRRHRAFLRRRGALLHTAPEPCLAAALERLPQLRRTTVDRFDPAAEVNADLAALPFPDGRFDRILSSHVLEHLRDDAAAIAELARVLRPGGLALIMVPYDPRRPQTEEGREVACPAERLARFGHPYHYRIYGADLGGRLARAGFRVQVVSARRLLAPHWRRRYRINRNHIFVCERLGGRG